jgi:hypothetical protein
MSNAAAGYDLPTGAAAQRGRSRWTTVVLKHCGGVTEVGKLFGTDRDARAEHFRNLFCTVASRDAEQI